MKLTGILKEKVAKAETREEKKNIIADAGMELTDEELDGVAGGIYTPEGMIWISENRKRLEDAFGFVNVELLCDSMRKDYTALYDVNGIKQEFAKHGMKITW